MPNDKGRPEPLGGALARFLQNAGLSARVSQAGILEQWGALVGPEIASATQALSISADGVLFVGVKSHAWMSELSMMERELLDAVNARSGSAPLKQIRFQLAR